MNSIECFPGPNPGLGKTEKRVSPTVRQVAFSSAEEMDSVVSHQVCSRLGFEEGDSTGLTVVTLGQDCCHTGVRKSKTPHNFAFILKIFENDLLTRQRYREFPCLHGLITQSRSPVWVAGIQ